MPLSNVKRLFRSRFQLELSETALGHAKLCELLQDPCFSDICSVRLESNGYMVLQNRALEPSSVVVEAKSEPKRVVFCLEEPLCFSDVEVFAEVDGLPLTQTRQPTPGGALRGPQWPALPAVSPSTVAPGGSLGKIVQNTFIHAACPPLTPVPGARPRSNTLPCDMWSDKDNWEALCNALSFQTKPIDDQSDATGETTEGSCHSEDAVSASECPDDELSSPTSFDAERRPQFCLDEPLDFSDTDFSNVAETRVAIRNTFLHLPPPLPTPLPGGSRQRAQSLPLDERPELVHSSATQVSPMPSPTRSPFPQTPFSPMGSPAFLRIRPVTSVQSAASLLSTKLAQECQAAAASQVLRLADHLVC